MSAFLIFTRLATKDPERLAAYGAKARDAAPGHTMKALIRYGETEVLEGDSAEGVMMLEFPSMEAARQFYFSDKYQEAKQLRDAGADYQVLLVEGLA